MASKPEGVSCITVQDISPQSRFTYASPSIVDVLGYEPEEIVGMSPFDIIHPEELATAGDAFYDALHLDRAATVGFLRFKHKDGTYRAVRATWTVVTDCVVSGIESTPDAPLAPSNLLRTATAQEVLVFTPSALEKFSMQQWHNGSLRRTGKVPERPENAPPLNSLPKLSVRQALILDRFTIRSTILFCTNSMILDASACSGRSFFDFISEQDEGLVRNWINNIKGSRVESGVTTDTGFGYGRFELCPQGRQSHGRARKKSGGARTLREQRSAGHLRQSVAAGATQEPIVPDVIVTTRQPVLPNVAPPAPGGVGPMRGRRRGSMGRDGDGRHMMEAIFDAHSDGIIVIIRQAEM
ncbi:hypothetical protein FRC04_001482 [Tulasnella sp. 424]|nr:hypothetical protein FRC04_001482 [Tulasnella sp. 424]KAG8974539.1 hypothetical protein FRC05_007171 [Tulasnella sp. 425]